MTKSNIAFDSRRSAVYGTHGMVACSQPLAAQVGVDILKSGGNAADAAIATVFALSLLEPMSSGICGDAFCLYYDSSTHTVKGLDGSGRTPAALTYEIACQDPFLMNKEAKLKSVHTVTVPGALAAYSDVLKNFGSKKFNLSDVVSPTITMAENGVPISQISSLAWKSSLSRECSGEYKKKLDWALDDCRGAEEGEIVTMLPLAKTYKKIAAEGADALYKGSIGENIVKILQEHGSMMTMKDLANHSSVLFEPISMEYCGSTVWQVPPVSQGITTLMALGIIEALEKDHGVEFSKIEDNSPEYIHIVTEALRLAFADTRRYVSDASSSSIPTEMLLNKEYLRERAKLIDFKKKNNNVQYGYPDIHGGTTYIAVVDQQGNACSLMSSIMFSVPYAPAIPDTGILLQNRGAFFSLDKDHPNAIGPSKKPLHTLMPSIMTRKTENGHMLETCFGIMGAFQQHQGLLHFILKMKHYMSNPQRILDAPRISISPTKENRLDYNNSEITNDSIIHLEAPFCEETANDLQSKGHICKVMGPNAFGLFGRAQIIFSKIDSRSGKRVLVGGSDPRADGQVIGLYDHSILRGRSRL